MSWSLNEIPNPSFSAELDRYITEIPEYDEDDEEEEPVHRCENCEEPIWEGDIYYDIPHPNGGLYCEECMDNWKYTAFKRRY